MWVILVLNYCPSALGFTGVKERMSQYDAVFRNDGMAELCV
jgi:hypothetical protein